MNALAQSIRGSGVLVVKIGSSLLIDESGGLRRAWMRNLVAGLSARSGPVVLVSSGAIALGRGALGLSDRPRLLAQAQAAAAVGQIHLAGAWSKCWQEAGRQAAQILLTLGDLENRRSYLNARATLETLIERGMVPVVNENDTVATEEIRFGDNDRLAARVAQLLGAEALLLLSDVDGLYTRDPAERADAQHIAWVEAVTPQIEALAGGSGRLGTGGMASKLAAARIACAAGVAVWLASGLSEDPIGDLVAGARATGFSPSAQPRARRKQWLAGLQQPSGTLHLDDGAVRALRSGASLLAVGITAVDGQFERGDLVRLDSAEGIIGQGLSAYPSDQARAIIGCHSRQIAEVLDQPGRGAIIHRDDLVLLRG